MSCAMLARPVSISPTDATSHIPVDSAILLADKAGFWGALDPAILMNEHWTEIYDVLPRTIS
jgi:hypothetical protein